MKYYLQLQFLRLQRWFNYIGLNYILGGLILAMLFFGLSEYLFYRLEYASLIYLVFSLYYLFQLNNKYHNELVKSLFGTNYYTIRLIENLFLSLPFIAFLLYKSEYVPIVVVLFLGGVIPFLSFETPILRSIPTPFKRYPFEFIAGFRKNVILIFLMIFILYKAIEIGNFNLSIFCLMFLAFLACSFILSLEASIFVWIFGYPPKLFLFKKIKIFSICYLIFILPFGALIVYFFDHNWLFALGVGIYGWMILILLTLCKYSTYPRSIGIADMLIITFSVIFPPLIIFSYAYYFNKSKNRLRTVL